MMKQIFRKEFSHSPATLIAYSLLQPFATLYDGLADRFLTTVNVVTSALLSASILQERTGYTDFSAPQAKSDDYWLPNSAERYKSLKKESKRVHGFLGIIVNNPLCTPYLTAISQIWLDAYHPHLKYLLINRRSDLTQLLAALKALGIPAKDLEVLIPDVVLQDEHAIWALVEQWLLLQGLSVCRRKRMPSDSSKDSADNRIGLMLRASESHQLGYQRTLNRALFVASVWLQLSGAYMPFQPKRA